MQCSQIRSHEGGRKIGCYAGVTVNRIREKRVAGGGLDGRVAPGQAPSLDYTVPKFENSYLLDRHDIIGFPPMNFEDTQLLTMPEAAAALRVCKRSLERLIAAKEFPAPLQIGGRRLVPMSDVGAYVERLLRRRNGGRVQP